MNEQAYYLIVIVENAEMMRLTPISNRKFGWKRTRALEIIWSNELYMGSDLYWAAKFKRY